MSKRIPRLRNDEAAEALLEQDLSDYLDQAHMAPLTYEYRPKDKAVSLRLSETLLRDIKRRAAREGIPYQRFMRQALERAVRS